MRAPTNVTTQKSKMSEILKAMEQDARNAQKAENIAPEFEGECEAVIERFNAAADAEGVPEAKLISRADYQAAYGRK